MKSQLILTREMILSKMKEYYRERKLKNFNKTENVGPYERGRFSGRYLAYHDLFMDIGGRLGEVDALEAEVESELRKKGLLHS